MEKYDDIDKLFFDNDDSLIKIYLDKELLASQKLTVIAKMVYISLRFLAYKRRKDYVLFDYVKYVLTDNFIQNKSFEQKIKQGIAELIDKEYIISLSSTKNGIELSFDNIYFSTNPKSDYFKFYTWITLADIHKIMNIKNQSPENILIYFCNLLGTISNASKQEISDKPISYLAELSRVSISTAIRYNHILFTNGLLAISKSNQAKTNDKNQIVSGLPNIYSRPENRHIAEAEQLSREQTQGTLGYKKLSVTADKKRSIKMKMNQVLKGKGKYSLDEISEMIIYLEHDLHNNGIEIKKRKDERERGLLSEQQFTEQTQYLENKKNDLRDKLTLIQEYYDKTERRLNDERDTALLSSLDDEEDNYIINESKNTAVNNNRINVDDIDFDEHDDDIFYYSTIAEDENDNIRLTDKYEIDFNEQLKMYFPQIKLGESEIKKLRKHKKDYKHFVNLLRFSKTDIKQKIGKNADFDSLISCLLSEIISLNLRKPITSHEDMEDNHKQLFGITS